MNLLVTMHRMLIVFLIKQSQKFEIADGWQTEQVVAARHRMDACLGTWKVQCEYNADFDLSQDSTC